MKSLLLPVIALCMTAATGQAATIAWSSASAPVSGTSGGVSGANLNTGLFTTTGTQIFAQNSGGAAVTFDGINFAASPGGPFTIGAGTFTNFHGDTVLADTGSFLLTGPGTISLTGLTTGYTYRVQALVIDGRTLGRNFDANLAGRRVSFDGINQGTYANGTDGVGATYGAGLLVTGTFVADGTTQNFTVQNFRSDGTTSTGAQINALTLYQTAIPEPSAALLGGLGLLALLRRRRA